MEGHTKVGLGTT